MTKTKKPVTSRHAKTSRTKRSSAKTAGRSKPIYRHTRFHVFIALLAIGIVGTMFTWRTLTAHATLADPPNPWVFTYGLSSTSSGIISSVGGDDAPIPYADRGSHPSSTYTGTYTYSLSYTTSNGNPLRLQIQDGKGGLVASSSSGNPIVIKTPAADDVFSIQELNYPNYAASGSLTLTVTWSPDPAPPLSPPTPKPTSTPSPTRDMTAPSVPSSLQATATGPNMVHLAWQPSTDVDSRVAGYRVYQGSSPTALSLLKTVTTTSYDDDSVGATTTHYYYVTAFDATGNTSAASNVVSATSPAFPPPQPTVTISTPRDGGTDSGIVNLNGWAGNGTPPIKSAEIEVDNNGFVAANIFHQDASGTDFNYSLNTHLYSDSQHTITAKVTDSLGTSSTTTITVTFKNGVYSATPPLAQGTWVSPEGMTIVVNSTGKNPHTGQPWTIADLYYMVKSCAVGTGDFATIAPYYTAEILDNIGNLVPADAYTRYSISNSSGNPKWYNYGAATYFRGNTGAMQTEPYDVACYEYGHVWTEYYYYMIDDPIVADAQDSSSPLGVKPPQNYLNERWVKSGGSVTLAQNDLCMNSVDYWDGCITDDRRILFGGPGANGGDDSAERVPGEPNTGFKETDQPYVNGSIVPPLSQPGLADWYKSHWMTGQ